MAPNAYDNNNNNASWFIKLSLGLYLQPLSVPFLYLPLIQLDSMAVSIRSVIFLHFASKSAHQLYKFAGITFKNIIKMK